MITIDDYMTHLRNKGNTVGEIRKTEADMITNATFRGDPACRRVYILDPQRGWHWTEAKLHKHLNQSLSSDAVDSYLQFRPKEHYPVGTYVFIPEDESYDIHLNEEHPFRGNLSHLWLICERSDSRQTVQYLVLQINWNFKWVVGYGDQKKILNCWGCIRNASSYTSGIWRDFRIDSLDNITRGIVPDVYNLYGDNITVFDLCDTRTITHQIRMMITNNDIHPNCYMVSKVDDTTPMGLINLTFKQDDYNPKRDNIPLKVCDYYLDTGDISSPEMRQEPNAEMTSGITYMAVNGNGELETSQDAPVLNVGETYYYSASFSDGDVVADWRITLVGDDDDRLALEKLMVLRNVDDHTVSVRPGKSNRIKGKSFTLTVCDADGNYKSSITLEVAE